MKEKYGCFLILLGGTGAKCGEILIHMCANGYLECDRLDILYIESDSNNGNGKQLENVVNLYKKCKEQYLIKESSISFFFKTEISFDKKSPVEGYERFRELASPSGQDIVGINSAEMLMKALYSEEEQNMKISDGFFAHPNVGSAFFAANMDKIMDKYCKLMQSDKGELKHIKVFMIGSIFGGTGASSLPTISKYLKKKLVGESDNKNINEQVKIGGCMVLPYFSFSRENVRKKIISGEDVNIEADKFVTKTRAALKYFKKVDEKQDSNVFDCLYLLGHDQYDVRGNYQTAGGEQRNMPHITEFYSAMSAVDFFEGSMEQYGRFFAVVPSEKISWPDIHKYPSGYFNFFVMMRFAIVMKSLILEELFDHTKEKKLKEKARDIPWFYDFLNGRDRSSDMDEDKLYGYFDAISKYCDEYIRWFAELNISNLEKRNDLGSIEFEGDNGESDVMEYLQFFDKKLIIKQHYNNCIAQGDVKIGDSAVYEDTYKKNIKYIRDHFQELELVHGYSDKKTEKIKIEKIWSRICDLGFSSTIQVDNILYNISTSPDKSMKAGVRNLVNAVFIACTI